METHESNNTINLPGPSNVGCNTWNRCIGNTGATDTESHPPEYHQIVPTLRSNIEQMRKCISIDLLSASQREANFLRMIERKAPILYQQNVIENAVRRYECFWLPMQVNTLLISQELSFLLEIFDYQTLCLADVCVLEVFKILVSLSAEDVNVELKFFVKLFNSLLFIS